MYFINNIKFKIRNSFYFQCLINKFDYTFHEKYYEIDFSILKKLNLKTYVDIGTNKGEYVNFLKNKSKKIYCFEPIKKSYQILKKIFRIKKIYIYNFALSNQNKFSKINIPIYRNHLKQIVSYAYNQSSIDNYFKDSISENIKIRKGDNFLKYQKNIELIKIDVEGHELRVLKGIKKTILKNKPILLIEIEKRHCSKFINTFNFLKDLDYEIYYVHKLGCLKKICYNRINTFLSNHQKLEDLKNESLINDYKNYNQSKKYVCNFWFIKKNNKLINI